MITGKVAGDKYIYNGIAADVAGLVPDMSTDTYYEVIRLIDGKLLFLFDHLDRLQQSLFGTIIPFPGKEAVTRDLRLLIEQNSIASGNIRICLQSAPGGGSLLQCYFIPYHYPEPEMYRTGVRLATFPHTRPRPGIKKWDDQFRNSVSVFIRQKEVYEAILLNPANEITEGSRSNVFFIDPAGHLITTPEKEVLPGITRRYVLEIAAGEGLHILKKTISVYDLDKMEAVFISGTSPKVLPVNQIDQLSFRVEHPVLRILMTRFERLIKQNLSQI